MVIFLSSLVIFICLAVFIVQISAVLLLKPQIELGGTVWRVLNVIRAFSLIPVVGLFYGIPVLVVFVCWVDMFGIHQERGSE